MILSVIGHPVPFLVEPQELKITTPITNKRADTISFFIFSRFLNNIEFKVQKYRTFI